MIRRTNAVQTIPCPGSFLAISSVYSLNRRSADREVRARAARRPRRSPTATGSRSLDLRRPVGLRAGDAVRQGDEARRRPSASRRRSSSRPMSRPGTDIVPYGKPSAASVSGTGPSQSGLPAASRITRSGAGPNPFSWNVYPPTASGSLTRIVLRATSWPFWNTPRSVVKSVGWPVSSSPAPRSRSSSRARRSGVPIGWTVSESPSAIEQPLLVAEPPRHDGRDEEQDQPEVGEERRELRPAMAVAVRGIGSPSTSASRTRKRSRRSAARTSSAATPVIAARSGSVGVVERRRAGRPGSRRPGATAAASARGCRRRSR